MTKILLVVGSARKNRVANVITGYVQSEIAKRDGLEAEVADLAEVNLPFFDSEVIPADPTFDPSVNPHAAVWQKLVNDTDVIIFITPEYNHTLSAIQKNAIDWLYKEWEGKNVSATAYGWSGGSQALATFNTVLENVKATIHTPAQLAFMKEINPDGTAINEEEISKRINAQLDDLV